jgi:phosphopantothenoylcysteine decarboxylase / phosphopantothenate---cysteine ligase
MKQFNQKHILVGITGGIAAYKSAELVRNLRQAGAKVRVIMTAAAKQFITPLTLQALSGEPVHDDLFDAQAEAGMGHIALARWADAMVIAPASADAIAQLAHGQARDLLTTVCLATRAPILIAPAMNQVMWLNHVTQANSQRLRERRYCLIGPAEGEQACGDVGPGRMVEPWQILEKLASLFINTKLAGVRVLITAGPTREAIDPVRYLSNHSSGKMGYALAIAALEAGATVDLISGTVALSPPEDANVTWVETAQQMYDAVMATMGRMDIFIAAAAVADYRCATPSPCKIKKSTTPVQLQLVPNPDIVAEVAASVSRPFIVGFAAETDDVEQKAQQKRITKGMDMIAANQVGVPDRGFVAETNELAVFWQDGYQLLPVAHKQLLATQLIALISEQYHAKYPG